MKCSMTLTTAALALVLAACGASGSSHSNEPHPDEHEHETQEGEHGHESAEEDHDDVVRLSPEAAAEAGIILGKAEAGPVGQILSLPAEIRFDDDRVAKVSPKVSGVIARLYASEGDTVARGDTLALITSRELAGLKATWLNAETNESLAAKALAREEQLWTDRITSEADVQAARARFEAAKAASDAAENELHAAGVTHAALEKIATADDGDNANSYLTAPIGGTVVQRSVTLGETVSAGDASAPALFTIVDDRVVWADIAVYKQDVSRISVGAPVSLKSGGGTGIAEAAVALVLPVINETSRTATARVIVDNPEGHLRPGQFVTAEINITHVGDVLRVPQDAVQVVEDQPSVFVPVEDGFAPRPITTGMSASGFVEIKSGLSEGESFVLSGAFTLKAQLEKDAFGDGHGH
ncbi:MAG: efflux transporter periplasmic adaptor subunit [Hyphomonas sp.]|nr:efflux transporter periplasmic adaptor subunit [Hyphomonas sp.]|tara:strand:+ start:12955 stop:14187 length:1233 start_codon:yes stop_codon:yes gene_type:complete